MPTKLPELLAVQGTLRGQATKTVEELKVTFEKKHHLFEGNVQTFTPYVESETVKERTEASRDLNTTVTRELDWITPFLAKSWDTDLAIDRSNLNSTADITLEDGTVLCKGVPVPALLSIEQRAEQVHQLILAIPTLDPAKDFKPDPSKGDGVYISREVEKVRTEKKVKPIVLVPPTVEHPAQAQLITEDEKIGIVRGKEWSGLITPADKSAMLARSEAFKRAVAQARMRANDQEADLTVTIGQRALSFIFKNERPA